jgi:peptide-methionine (S)-S-oxide reductase
MHRILLFAASIALYAASQTFGMAQERTAVAPAPPAGMAVATFAAGCFWCLEPPFDKVEGVVSTTSGYTSGPEVGPTYREVSAGRTGHTEAVRVVYDPAKVSYDKLLDVFWRNVDPVDGGGQFCDRGRHYRPGIYPHGPEQARLAKASLETVAKRFREPIAVEIVEATPFYVAEDYHQDYYLTNPLKYKYYRLSCGRDARLRQVWGEAPAAVTN